MSVPAIYLFSDGAAGFKIFMRKGNSPSDAAKNLLGAIDCAEELPRISAKAINLARAFAAKTKGAVWIAPSLSKEDVYYYYQIKISDEGVKINLRLVGKRVSSDIFKGSLAEFARDSQRI
jgi:hypothetical protein